MLIGNHSIKILDISLKWKKRLNLEVISLIYSEQVKKVKRIGEHVIFQNFILSAARLMTLHAKDTL